jgi:D-3-phosphoglycerate dehydrogenase
VAELTLGMILALLRKIPVADASIKANNWIRPMGNLLYGKTVGIVGCGRIGTRLAKLLMPFDCAILGYDPYQIDETIFKAVKLDTLLQEADVVSLHLPYSSGTHHFMDAKKIGFMKRTSVLINAARGGLIDENALAQFLGEERLAGAALDCFETEPYNGPLAKLDNILLTTHIGSYAIEGRVNMEMTASTNLVDELRKTGVLA